MAFRVILSLIAGYLIGSVVAAIIISRVFFREDVRLRGSGNSGATNAARVYGLPFGVLTFLIDFAKGVLACALGRALCGGAGLACAGFACVLGHCFPAFFRFRGGKGVSVGAAFALMMDWRIFVAAIAVFIIFVSITKIVSLGSISATVVVGVLALLIPEHPAVRALGLAAAVVVIAMHHANIGRLFRGEEKQMSFGKR